MGNEREQGDLILPRSARFADAVTAFSRHHEGRSIILDLWLKQFWRAGTSIAANVEESQSGESRADFIHKMHIALKEARETRNWLRNAMRGELFPVAVPTGQVRVKLTERGKAREVAFACLIDPQLALGQKRQALRESWRRWAAQGKREKCVESWLLSDAWLLFIEARQLVKILGKIVGTSKRRQV